MTWSYEDMLFTSVPLNHIVNDSVFWLKSYHTFAQPSLPRSRDSWGWPAAEPFSRSLLPSSTSFMGIVYWYFWNLALSEFAVIVHSFCGSGRYLHECDSRKQLVGTGIHFDVQSASPVEGLISWHTYLIDSWWCLQTSFLSLFTWYVWS